MTMSWLFWGSILLVVHAYFGYPLSLALAGAFRSRPVRKGSLTPSVTLIITAYNEEKRIASKIANSLRLRYPKDKIQILVASDGSTDGTNAIVDGHAKDGVELLAFPERKGKENAQREAVKFAHGEILVFTDVATELEPEGVAAIVSNFADPAIGCVSSEDRLIGKDGRPSGEGFYVRYEMWLRRLESRVNSLVGLSGSFFAARKGVCQNFSPDLQSDFRTVLDSVRLGLRAVIDPEAVGHYRDVAEGKREFDRKVRTVIRGITVFFRHKEFLNIATYGFFSYQYFCHKFLRWSVPLLLLVAYLTNVALCLAGSPLYIATAMGQTAFYLVALWGWRTGAEGRTCLVKVPAYFLAVNASIMVAWWRYFKGVRVVMWAPSER